jgi:arylsulfatase A-like enzyme/tetratricopeptide (TPR) repeat protein
MPAISTGNRRRQGRKGIVAFLWIAGLVAIALGAYFLVSGGFLSPGAKLAAEKRKLFGHLDSRDLNVLFFTLDTTRADHLGCYGYPYIETPHIDRLAAKGFLFKNVTSQAPLTLPSHASIFTGTYPCYNGVRDNGGFYLEPDQTTLAEVLKKAGWATSAFIGAFVLDSRWGINQGFDYYYDHFDFAKYKTISFDTVQRNGDEVIRSFFGWLELNRQQKFFSWIHLYDPHTPYEPPEPYRTRYGGRTWGLYDGEIAYVDSLIGQVIERLENERLLDRTLIVIAADHGESLGEHNESGHGFFVYDATQSVPLIVRTPSQNIQARIIESQVENVDIMPSLLEMLGLDAPPQVQGRSFFPLMAGRTRGPESLAYSETYYPRYRYGWSDLKSVRSAQFKFIQAPRPELYDLVRDPHELSNIYSPESENGRRLERELRNLEARMSAKGIEDRGPQNIDNDAREKLMALGYLGGFTSSSKLRGPAERGDPKDKILLYNKIKLAEGAATNREFDDALKLLDEALAEDSGIMEARQIKASIYLQLERPQESIAECREALKVDENYEAAIFIMAKAFQNQKKYDEAVSGYNRIIQLNPKDPDPYLNLGDIYYTTRDLDKAIPSLQTAISLDPQHSGKAHNLLGLAYLEQGMPERAIEEIRLALQIRPNIPDAHYNLGTIYEHKGETDNAIQEYKKEIEIHPDAYPAHYNLALIYGQRGLVREQVSELQETIKANDKFARAYLFLAKAYLDLNEKFESAIGLVREGLELEPEAESAPLGHYVLADIYSRLGRRTEASAEVEKGQALERKLGQRKSQAGIGR